jgi:hypothetical protein
MGDKSSNLLFEPELESYVGAILSPVNEDFAKVVTLLGRVRSTLPEMEMIFDPQLYFPTSNRGKLRSWPHFPKDVDSADRSSPAWWTKSNRLLAKVVSNLQPDCVCSPALVPKVYSNEFYDRMIQVGDELKAMLAGCSVLQTVILSLNDMTAATRPDEVASIISRSSCDRVFLVIVSDVDPRRELSDVEGLKGVMRLIHLIEGGGQSVLVGFCSTDLVVEAKHVVHP